MNTKKKEKGIFFSFTQGVQTHFTVSRRVDFGNIEFRNVIKFKTFDFYCSG